MTLVSIDDGAREYLLALADDEHMMGSHLAWWIGIAPFLEEDLSLCSIAQDELGHAIAVYELLVDDVDHFALGANRLNIAPVRLWRWRCRNGKTH